MTEKEIVQFFMERRENARKLRNELFERKNKLGEDFDNIALRLQRLDNGINNANSVITLCEEVIAMLSEEGGEEC